MSPARLLALTAAGGAMVALLGALACSGSGNSGIGDAGVTGDAEAGAGDDAADAGDAARDAPPSGVPVLTALAITSSGATPPVTLSPPFASDVYDYYVRCAEGVNELAVSMVASPGAMSLLTEPTISPSRQKQTVSIHVDENAAIVAEATDGIATTPYWVRCLPHDFPPLLMTSHAAEKSDAGVTFGSPPPGYYLVGNLLGTLAAGSAGYAMVLDVRGVPVWYHRAPTGLGAANVDAVVPGAISFIPFAPTLDESFDVLPLSPWSPEVAAPAGYPPDMHELRVLPNGDYLVLSYPLRYGVDLTGLELPLSDGGTQALGPDSIIEDCAVVEFAPSGTVTWTWFASDHFDPAKVSTLPIVSLGAPPPDGGVAYDVFRCDSIDVDPVQGNLLISGREMDSVFYVSRSNGKVLWKMGGRNESLDDATYVSVADRFWRQHDARLVPGWSSCNGGVGQISMFDDESNEPGPSRAAIYDVVVGDGDDSCDAGGASEGVSPGTAKLAWSYSGATPSGGLGSFRVSADGSIVIGWGLGGNGDVVFTEVDSKGHDLLDFSMTDGNRSYRAIKVPTSAFDLSVLRSTSGLP